MNEQPLFPITEESPPKSLLTKWCTICGKRKRLDEYPIRRNSRDGRCSRCFDCNRSVLRDRYHTEAGKAAQIASNNRNKVRIGKTRFHRARCCVLSRKKGCMEWKLTYHEWMSIINGKLCYYCDGPLPSQSGAIDRIDNDKGYEVGNCVPCCTICNRIRSDVFTVEEMKNYFGPIVKRIREERASKGLPPLEPEYFVKMKREREAKHRESDQTAPTL